MFSILVERKPWDCHQQVTTRELNHQLGSRRVVTIHNQEAKSFCQFTQQRPKQATSEQKAIRIIPIQVLAQTGMNQQRQQEAMSHLLLLDQQNQFKKKCKYVNHHEHQLTFLKKSRLVCPHQLCDQSAHRQRQQPLKQHLCNQQLLNKKKSIRHYSSMQINKREYLTHHQTFVQQKTTTKIITKHHYIRADCSESHRAPQVIEIRPLIPSLMCNPARDIDRIFIRNTNLLQTVMKIKYVKKEQLGNTADRPVLLNLCKKVKNSKKKKGQNWDKMCRLCLAIDKYFKNQNIKCTLFN